MSAMGVTPLVGICEIFHVNFQLSYTVSKVAVSYLYMAWANYYVALINRIYETWLD